jgi:hypothetical protein
MNEDEAKQLKVLQLENGRLKKQVLKLETEKEALVHAQDEAMKVAERLEEKVQEQKKRIEHFQEVF